MMAAIGTFETYRKRTADVRLSG